MKKIVQIVQHLRPGGLEIMALELMKHSSFGQSMKIMSLEGNAHDAFKAWPRLKAFESQLIFMDKPQKTSFSFIKKLTKTIASLQTDVVHTHHIGPFLYGGIAAYLNKLPHLHTEHDAWHYQNKKHRLLHRLISTLNNPTEIADAHIVALDIHKITGAKKPNVIKNGIDTHYFIQGDQKSAREKLMLPLEGILLGSSGRLEKVKGHHVLISALRHLPSNYQLVIAGDGSQAPQLNVLAKQLGLKNRVHFLGHIDNMPDFYQSIDLFCLPSFNEGFPLSPLEAQACGIPAAVTKVGGAEETLCSKTGVLLRSGAPFSMAKKIETHFSNPIKDSPRDFVLQHADVRQMAHAYDAITAELTYG